MTRRTQYILKGAADGTGRVERDSGGSGLWFWREGKPR